MTLIDSSEDGFHGQLFNEGCYMLIINWQITVYYYCYIVKILRMNIFFPYFNFDPYHIDISCKLIKTIPSPKTNSDRYLFLHKRMQGQIQDLWLGGAWVDEGSGDRLMSPADSGQRRQSPGRGHRGANPPLLCSGGLRNYRHLIERQFWTNHTIFIRPRLWVLILSDNC